MSLSFGTQHNGQRIFRLAVTCVSTFLLFQFVTLFLSWPKQMVIGAASIAVAILLNRSTRSHVVTIALMLVSLAATLRYGWWRIHMILQFFSDESNDRLQINSILMLVLLSAELYTILIMVLGFMQTASPLRRKPIPLPADEDLWPHVDVLIPTYNEPLDLVRYTALAAINIDYPPAKLHVYILDDGTRETFRQFAEEAGIGYVVRKHHNHAKAGNINHALAGMSSPLVTIFDCDHVPTRSFLQVTVGWFLADKKLAMLQTPHFFYSPDPFERNLLQYKSIPNEGELFYGIIQDGNDLWNATFFCGSCAVIRREALDEVGGIATETVTEDAHTSLRMQNFGWNTAYINLPQAAGLATETLAAHVGQRVRWARGMVQIFRTENPLLARGMTFTQRLCYFNAMLHFLYAVPRLLFLVAPLIYMLGGRTIIPGYWAAIVAYALPHLVISSITNSRVQGRHRHSFWNEIYETVLAPYILLPTLLALINPKLGKFNVTDKGSTLAETTFDRRIAAPTTWLLGLNLLGVLAVPYRLMVTDPDHPGTVVSNLIWILFNMIILGVAAAVANEQQQRRSSVRIPARIKVLLHRPNASTAAATSLDLSVGGASLTCEREEEFSNGEHVYVSFPMQTGEARVAAKVVGRRGTELRLKFDAFLISEQETLACAIYSRADSWISARSHIKPDRPLLSLARVIRLSFTGFSQVLRGSMPRKKRKLPVPVTIALLISCLAVLSASAQTASAGRLNVPALFTTAEDRPQADTTAAPTTGQLSSPQALTLFVPNAPPVEASQVVDKITLTDMGVHSAIDFHGPHAFSSLEFVLPHGIVARNATLNLTYHFSSALLPHTGVLIITLNDTKVAQIAAPQRAQGDDEYAFVSLPIPSDMLFRTNELKFEFKGSRLFASESAPRSAVLGNVGATSTLLVAGEHLPLKNDLSLLPLPFFDADLQTPTTIPFVFMTPPTPGTLQAAAIVASWLGVLASSQPIRFTVAVGSIPAGNVIVFTDRPSLLPQALNVPGGGATLSIKPNPASPGDSALILAGDDEGQLVNVARALALMKLDQHAPGEIAPILGESVHIGDFSLPAARKIDDAPRWLDTTRLTPLTNLASADALRSNGSNPIPLYFRVPPDLHYGEDENLTLKLAYRYNALPIAPHSALRIFANGSLISDIPLSTDTRFVERERTLLLPVAQMRPFGNTISANFDFVPNTVDNTGKIPAEELSGSILRNTYLDLRGLDHWVAMPDLELFSNAGFPFTRRADLAETSIVMPFDPNPKEITLMLYILGHCGRQTGYPSLRVEIAGPDVVMSADRDYLILGKAADQPAFSVLSSRLPATLDADGLHVKDHAQYYSQFVRSGRRMMGLSADAIDPSDVRTAMLIEGIQSPFSPDRSIVTMSLSDDAAVDQFAEAFLDRSQSSDISKNVSVLQNGHFMSYALDTPAYHVGTISPYRLMRIWFTEHFWVLLGIVSLLSLVLAAYVRDYLALLTKERLRVSPDLYTTH